MATPPITIIRMASTFARTGRLMKKSEIMAPPANLVGAGAWGWRGGDGLQLWIDLLTGDGPQDAGDDHAVVGLEAAVDGAQVADFGTDRDLALLDDVVLVDDEHIAPALVAAERRVRHQQGSRIFGADPYADEISAALPPPVPKNIEETFAKMPAT
jgi:hypothetical protein